MSYTTTDLIANVKRRATMANASAATFTDADILMLATDALQAEVTPIVMRYMEEYSVATIDYDISGQKAVYRFPSRSVGAKLRDVKWVDINGREWFLARLEPDLPENQQLERATQPAGYIIQSNSLQLYPLPMSTVGKLRIRYYIRPNKLVSVAATGVVEEVNGQVVTVGSAPTTFTGARTYDVIKSTSGFEHALVGAKPTVFTTVGPGSYEMTFDSGVDLSAVEVGDYVNLAEESCVPQLPADAHKFLYQLTAAKVLELQGDAQAVTISRDALNRLESNLPTMMAPRVDSAKLTIRPYMRDWLLV